MNFDFPENKGHLTMSAYLKRAAATGKDLEGKIKKTKFLYGLWLVLLIILWLGVVSTSLAFVAVPSLLESSPQAVVLVLGLVVFDIALIVVSVLLTKKYKNKKPSAIGNLVTNFAQNHKDELMVIPGEVMDAEILQKAYKLSAKEEKRGNKPDYYDIIVDATDKITQKRHRKGVTLAIGGAVAGLAIGAVAGSTMNDREHGSSFGSDFTGREMSNFGAGLALGTAGAALGATSGADALNFNVPIENIPKAYWDAAQRYFYGENATSNAPQDAPKANQAGASYPL